MNILAQDDFGLDKLLDQFASKNSTKINGESFSNGGTHFDSNDLQSLRDFTKKIRNRIGRDDYHKPSYYGNFDHQYDWDPYVDDPRDFHRERPRYETEDVGDLFRRTLRRNSSGRDRVSKYDRYGRSRQIYQGPEDDKSKYGKVISRRLIRPDYED